MATLKKQLFFGEMSDNADYHSHKIYVTDEFVIISAADDIDAYSNYIKIPFQEFQEIVQFVFKEIKENNN
jgi:hypothetical protein